jgi:hypothetical protein
LLDIYASQRQCVKYISADAAPDKEEAAFAQNAGGLSAVPGGFGRDQRDGVGACLASGQHDECGGGEADGFHGELTLETGPEDGAELKVGLIGRVGGLRERGDGDEPSAPPVRHVWPDENVADPFSIARIIENKLVQQFDANGETR